MKITPDLLEKYYQGLTNNTEKHFVEQWLSDGTTDMRLDFPLDQDENSIKADMWKNISSFKKKGSINSYMISHWNHLYRIAAVLVLFIGFLVIRENPYFLSRSIAFDNSGSVIPKIVQYNNLDLILASNSRCEINVPYFGSVSSIKFCGAVSVKNRSDSARSLSISMDYKDCVHKTPEVIKLKKGNTYLAMTDETFKMVAATTQELEDGIPRPFNLRLTERFNL
jgi:hypothetical protein